MIAKRKNEQSPLARLKEWSQSMTVADFVARYGVVLVLIVLVILMTILSPIIRGQQLFLTDRNLLQVALQASINAIIAIGMTFVITSGGIDLSVGSIVALAGVLAAMAMRDRFAAERYGIEIVTGSTPTEDAAAEQLAIPEALAAVREGRLAGTVAQFPDEMAYLAIEALIKVIEGRPVAPFIESPVVVITQDNLPE